MTTTDPRTEPAPREDAPREATPDETARDAARREPREVPPAPRATPFVAAGLVLLGLLAYGGYGHWREHAAARETQRQMQDFVPQVRTVQAKREDGPVPLTLPGATRAYATASLYARATGYVAERRVDIGSRVRKGDLLVRIAAPDLDQQLAQAEAQIGQMEALVAQAEAQVDQAKASQNLANVTNARTATLATQGWATKQSADTSSAGVQTSGASVASAEAGVKVAQANLKAQQATVDRLRALTAFENVVAPFDGVVTARAVEVGNLVNADAGGGTPLFTMDRDDILRVTTNVPQNMAAGMRDGIRATMRVPQYPDREFTGRVTRSSVALVTAARTLSTEVDIPNPDGLLRPGLFVDVTFAIPRTHPNVTVPSEALIFDQGGTQVALVQDDDTVRLQRVVIAKDMGTTLALRDGLQGDETVVLGPPAGLRDGARVKVDRGRNKPQGGTRQEASR